MPHANVAALEDLEEYFGKPMERGEGFTADDAKKYIAEITKDRYYGDETRLQRQGEEAVKK